MTTKPIDVLVIGAGFAGVCAGIKLLEQGVTRFRIVEKSEAVGGTWYENTYPGAACDIASHLYCFSFEPNPNWSRVYSPQPEILAYIEHCVEKYGLRPYITHGKRVVRQQLDAASGVWETTFADGDLIRSRHVISGIGGLHKPSIPDFAGRDVYGGVTMHSARWNHDYDFRGKRVAIIGTAASAVQIIPELAKEVDQLLVFQRTPNYVAPRYDRPYTEKEKARLRRWPVLSQLLRQFIFMRLELLFYPLIKKNSALGARSAEGVKEWMRSVIEDEQLHASMSPDYRMGCKRILISDNYYETFNRPNVTLVTDRISRFDETGIWTGDTHHAVDAIVYATGFNIDQHIASIDVVGRDNTSLNEVWEDIPLAYRGVCTAGFPNYWFVTGPNTGVGTTSIVFMIEQAVRYIMECIELAGSDHLIGVTNVAMHNYNAKIQAALGETVWASGGCKSWYMRPDGRIATLYPYNARSWRKSMQRVERRDFHMVKVA